VSARAGEESRVEGLEADADDYLIKPFAARELLARVAANVKMANLRRETAEREERLRSEAELEREKLRASEERLAETSRLYRELQNREAKIRRLIEANVVGIVMWELGGAITGANQAFLRMVQYDHEDLLPGRVRWADLTPLEWRDRDERAIAELKANGVFQPYEKEYFRKDGSRVPILLGGALVENSGNEGVAFVLDMSEQKRAETMALDARVNERTRIARELHDTLLQNFHGLMFQFQAAGNLMLRKPDEAKRCLDDAINETKKALAESREAIQGLRSEVTAKGNLAELLVSTSRELADSHANEHLPVFDLIEEGQRRTLSSTVSSEVCRIAVELVRNAYQHALAQRIEVEIRYEDDSFRLRIRDDGRGIDPKVLKEGGRFGHWGLRGVRERADRIGAHLDLWSEPGNGTEVQLLVSASVAYESYRDSYRAKLLRKVKDRA